MKPSMLLLSLFLFSAMPAAGQAIADTLLAWRGYARNAITHVYMYPAPPSDERSRTFLIREIAENRGPSSLEDALFLVEHVGRTFGVDPAEAYWIFHWGAFSFQPGASDPREVYLRATFRRNPSGTLAAPNWRLLTRAEVEALTDRRFRRTP
jgi:hypothetical protein